jgi:transposase-like protein
MTNGRVEVITSGQRRRRWNSAEKQQLVAESLEGRWSRVRVCRWWRGRPGFIRASCMAGGAS